MLAGWCGIRNTSASLQPRDLIEAFRLENLPKSPIIFKAEDDAWLLSAPR
jgi:hypothetical protein